MNSASLTVYMEAPNRLSQTVALPLNLYSSCPLFESLGVINCLDKFFSLLSIPG